MSDLHKANAVLPRSQRFHDSIDAVARQPEYHLNAPVADRFDENVAAGFWHTGSPLTCVIDAAGPQSARAPPCRPLNLQWACQSRIARGAGGNVLRQPAISPIWPNARTRDGLAAQVL